MSVWAHQIAPECVHALGHQTIYWGEEVVWKAGKGAPHTVTSGLGDGDRAAGALFDSPRLDTGEVFAQTFDEAGVNTYFSRTMPRMRGSMRVRELYLCTYSAVAQCDREDPTANCFPIRMDTCNDGILLPSPVLSSSGESPCRVLSSRNDVGHVSLRAHTDEGCTSRGRHSVLMEASAFGQCQNLTTPHTVGPVRVTVVPS